MLYEGSQTQKEMLYKYTYMRYSRSANLWRYKLYVGDGELLLNVNTDSVGGNGKVSKINSGDGCTL